eukprot:s1477_g13.t1
MVPVMTTTTTTNTVLQDILDRLEVTVNVKTEGEATKETAAEGEVLYPTDWAVIGALVLVIVFVTAIVCYSRTQERHLQCFGLAAYLEANLKMRALNNRWTCPVCSNVLKPHDLVGPGPEDGYVHHVYLAATEIIRVAGMRGYHTSVIVDSHEYFFDSIGILEAPPLFSHTLDQQAEGQGQSQASASDEDGAVSDGPVKKRNTVVTPMGYSSQSGRQLVAALQQHFERGTYDVFYKNCNTFTDCALYYLTKTRLPGSYNRIERLVTATKTVSIGLLNVIFKTYLENATGVEVEGDVYTPNPLSSDFSVDGLIRKLEGLDGLGETQPMTPMSDVVIRESDSESGSSSEDGEEESDEEPSLATRLSAAFSALKSQTCCRQNAALRVDKYVQKVLAETPANVEEVIIEKDGSYRIVEEEEAETAVKELTFSSWEKAKDTEKPAGESDEKMTVDGQDGLKRKGTEDGIEVPLSKRQRRRQKILEARGEIPHHEEAPGDGTAATGKA